MKHHQPHLLFILLFLTTCQFVVTHDSRAQEAGPLAAPNTTQGSTPSLLAIPGSGERQKNSRTIIDCDNGATFENASNTAEFTGHVVVHDPQFNLTCDKLHVLMALGRKGLSKVIATGSVVITQEKTNDRGDIVKSVGKCGKATYDAVTGDMTLEDWPQIQQGINNQIATEQSTIMILNSKGRSRTIGASRTMIVDQGPTAITP
jgi:lipopolysaccharide export system protein LptA